MNYEWTPITEPPDSMNYIVMWFEYHESRSAWFKGYFDDAWRYESGKLVDVKNLKYLTHWKDIKPPTK